MKADIGLVILEKPIDGDEIPLSQSPSTSLKSCSKCQYKSCYVYEYQSSKKLGTGRVKKIDVQLLDFSMCHPQHSSLEKTVGLCIQSQPREDCWVIIYQNNIRNKQEMKKVQLYKYARKC
uniref:Uncharacterized protein n=1 Tax=Mus spicilegus TaxID=10103 RepID=A0A8C6GTS1_MUSSI